MAKDNRSRGTRGLREPLQLDRNVSVQLDKRALGKEIIENRIKRAAKKEPA